MATTTRQVIGLWLDRTSDPNHPRWIVSRDTLGQDGGTESTATVRTFPADRYDDAYGCALEIAHREGLCIVEDGEGIVYDPATGTSPIPHQA